MTYIRQNSPFQQYMNDETSGQWKAEANRIAQGVGQKHVNEKMPSISVR